jgi:hypothetical protein
VHAAVNSQVVDTATLRVAYTGGWWIAPPAAQVAIGARSTAPRVISERHGADARYVVQLEGIARRAYEFRVGMPSPTSTLRVETSAGASATVERTSSIGSVRHVTIIFPDSGANADGYSTATVTFSAGTP